MARGPDKHPDRFYHVECPHCRCAEYVRVVAARDKPHDPGRWPVLVCWNCGKAYTHAEASAAVFLNYEELTDPTEFQRTKARAVYLEARQQ